MQRPNTDPGLIAQHFDAGRVPDQAVEHYVVAATSAQTAAADAEAIRYLDRALDLVLATPDGTARDRSELTVRVVRGRSHVSMQGFSAPDAAVDYRRSLELSERVGTGVDVVSATTAVWAYYLVHGELREAAEALDPSGRERATPSSTPRSRAASVSNGSSKAGSPKPARASKRRWPRSPTGARPAAVARLPMLPSDSHAVALTHLGTVLWLAGETRGGVVAPRRSGGARPHASEVPDRRVHRGVRLVVRGVGGDPRRAVRTGPLAARAHQGAGRALRDVVLGRGRVVGHRHRSRVRRRAPCRARTARAGDGLVAGAGREGVPAVRRRATGDDPGEHRRSSPKRSPTSTKRWRRRTSRTTTSSAPSRTASVPRSSSCSIRPRSSPPAPSSSPRSRWRPTRARWCSSCGRRSIVPACPMTTGSTRCARC